MGRILSIRDLLEWRTLEKRKVYFIQTEKEYYVIKGSYFNKANNDIVDIFYEVLKGKVSWSYLEKHINNYYDNTSKDWTYMDNTFKDSKLDLVRFFSNGKEITLT